MREFKLVNRFEAGTKVAYVVVADQDMDRDNTGLVGEDVLVDEDKIKVQAVEKFASGDTILVGEYIALIV